MNSITMNQNVKKTIHNEVFVSEGKTKLSDLWKKEDWLAVWDWIYFNCSQCGFGSDRRI